MDDMGTVWTIASVFTGAILAAASFVTWRQRWACLMASFFPMVVAVLIWAPMASNSLLRISVSGIIGGCFGALLLVGTTQLLHDKAREEKASLPEPAMPDKSQQPQQSFTGSGNFSINQHGGTINQTFVNQQPQKLRFTDAIGKELLSKIPRDKPLNITLTGTQSDLQVGEDFAAFFRQNGYMVNYTSAMILAPAPEHQLTLTETFEARNLVIAPSVR